MRAVPLECRGATLVMRGVTGAMFFFGSQKPKLFPCIYSSKRALVMQTCIVFSVVCRWFLAHSVATQRNFVANGQNQNQKYQKKNIKREVSLKKKLAF